LRSEGIEVVRKAIVTEIPDHRNAVPIGRIEDRLDRTPVIASGRLLHLIPADRLAHHTDPQLHDPIVVGLQMSVMARHLDIVFALTILPEESRALEPGHKKGRKQPFSGFWRRLWIGYSLFHKLTSSPVPNEAQRFLSSPIYRK